MAVFAEFGVLTDGGVGVNDTTVTNLHVAVNEYERTYFYILSDLCLGMNTC